MYCHNYVPNHHVLFVFVFVVVNTELFHRNCGLSVHENIHGSHSSIPRRLEVAWEWR